MNSIYLVPTRGRPQNALRLAKKFNETITDATQLIFLVDDDDPELTNYTATFSSLETDEMPFGYMVGPRLRLGGTLNYWAPKYAEQFDAIGFMGDDHLPQTDGWDHELNASVMVNGGIAYGNDLIQKENLPTAVLMDSLIIRTLGYMVPPGLTHMYLDNFWRDLGQATGRLTYRADVILQHVHPVGNTADWDPGYLEVAGFMGPDGDLYQQFQNNGEFAEAVRLVRAL